MKSTLRVGEILLRSVKYACGYEKADAIEILLSKNERRILF